MSYRQGEVFSFNLLRLNLQIFGKNKHAKIFYACCLVYAQKVSRNVVVSGGFTCSPWIFVRIKWSAVRTWFTVPDASITRSCVPGKNSLARLSCKRAPDCDCSSDMLAPPFPMILPAAALDIKNLAITFCSPAPPSSVLVSFSRASAALSSLTSSSASLASTLSPFADIMIDWESVEGGVGINAW